MPSISRITKKQGWQYILGIQQADPPWTGIIMFFKRLSKCPHMMRIMFGLWKTISLQSILWNITWLFWQVPGLQKHHNWGLSLPLRLGKGAWDELVHFSRGIKTKHICWLPPPGEWQQQRHWESWSWKGWGPLSREGDSLSSPTFHTNGVLNFCPYAYVTTYFSPPIRPSNYKNTITGFYIFKTYIVF